MNDDVFLLDRRETISAMLANALGKARVEGLELEVRPVVDNQLRRIIEPDQALLHEDFALGHLEFLDHEALQPRRHRSFDLKADHRAAPPLLERRLIKQHQVLGLFLDFQVAVPQHPERALTAHRVSRKQPRDEQADHRFQTNEPNALIVVGGSVLAARWQADKPAELARDRHQRVHGAVVFGAVEIETERKAHVWNKRERMGRIDRDRRQHRKDMIEKIAFEPFLVFAAEIFRIDHVDPGLR